MKRKTLVWLIILSVIAANVTFLVVLVVAGVGCVAALTYGGDRFDCEGLDEWSWATSSVGLTDSYFLEESFLTNYPYADGNYYYIYEMHPKWKGESERSFIWLTYEDADVYRDAKQSRFDKRYVLETSFDGTKAYGFTFYLYCDFSHPQKDREPERETQFPEYFTAFGYNDETRTLVFLGFDGSGKIEKPYIEYAKTDFPAFLSHFYSDRFDWEAGVGTPAPSDGGENDIP